MIISFDLCLGVETLKYPTQILGLRERSCFIIQSHNSTGKKRCISKIFYIMTQNYFSQLGVRNSKSIYYKVKSKKVDRFFCVESTSDSDKALDCACRIKYFI